MDVLSSTYVLRRQIRAVPENPLKWIQTKDLQPNVLQFYHKIVRLQAGQAS
jgi:hypothetical protein